MWQRMAGVPKLYLCQNGSWLRTAGDDTLVHLRRHPCLHRRHDGLALRTDCAV
jgi:hypothetical protein